MYDAQRTVDTARTVQDAAPQAPAAPGRQTLLGSDREQAQPSARGSSPSIFSGSPLPWALSRSIPTEAGVEMLAAMQSSPTIEADDLDEELDDESAAVGMEVDEDAAEPDEGRSAKPVATAAKSRKKKIPSSAYATEHGKEMRNFKFIGTPTVTNTFGMGFGGPNTYDVDPRPIDEQIKALKDQLAAATTMKERKALQQALLERKNEKKYGPKIRNMVSVDIGTVVGGKAPKFLEGWALVFHKTYVKVRGKNIRLNSHDHTGWIRVEKLVPRGRKAVAKFQKRLRAELRNPKKKGSGHVAKVKGGALTFDVQGAETIRDDQAFRIAGGSASTPLGNYTHNPDRYGDVIIGVWNPPGSGADGKRFSGSGGVRAFLKKADDQTFHLCKVAPMIIRDITGKGTSTWRYVRAEVNNEQVFCWVLEKWKTPKGKTGQNFRV